MMISRSILKWSSWSYDELLEGGREREGEREGGKEGGWEERK